MRKDVFISYKAEEFDKADWVRQKLENSGVSCWMAPADIPGGSSYASEIPAAIRACKIYVLILSSTAQKSKWIPRELDQAINENKVIMPFMIEDCALQDDFKFYLTNVQRYFAYEDMNNAIVKLIVDIKATLRPQVKEIDIPKEIEEDILEDESLYEKEKEPVYQKKTVKKEKKKSQFGRITARIGICFLLVFVGVQIVKFVNSVEIEGKRYDKSETYLQLKNARLDSKEIENIGKLERLQVLALMDCKLEGNNIGHMVGKKVKFLHLSNCDLTKEQIESLDFSNHVLQTVDLSGNAQVASLELIKPLANTLTVLSISDTSVLDISELAFHRELKELYANNCGISDISALSGCEKLQKLSLDGNKLESLEGLERCLELKEIWVSDNKLSSIQALENATVLEVVKLSGNQIVDASILTKSAKHIWLLNLADNSISDISWIEQFSELKNIILDGNQLTSLEHLKNAKNLNVVFAAGNQLTSTKGIEGLTQLQYVNLANNRLQVVGEQDALAFAEEKRCVLDLSGNAIEAMNVKPGESFKLLVLTGSDILPGSFVYSVKADLLILDYNEAIDFEALAACNNYSYAIVGCPLDQQLRIKEILKNSKVNFIDSIEGYYDIETYL